MKWTPAERSFLRNLKNPAGVQAFLDDIPYSTIPEYRCPRRVLKDHAAHCYDGALFAAAALRHLGWPPLITNLVAVRDDDHILALFKEDGLWGAVAKSNFSGLRFREPIHRSLRELAMTYFEDYFNVEGKKSLRAYTRPLHLKQFDHLNWIFDETGLGAIAERLDDLQRIPLLSKKRIVKLQPMDQRGFNAGMLGADQAGLYVPGKSSC